MAKAIKTAAPMTAKQYKQARLKLGISNYAFAAKIGVHLRTAQGYESGESKIPAPIALLIRCYLAHGFPS